LTDQASEKSTSHEPIIGSIVPIKSPLIDRVATFLGNQPNPTATSNKTVRPKIKESELSSWRESVHHCSHIAQLHLVVRKISKSRPGSQFRGMKRCLTDLKALKAMQNTGKNSSASRRRDNIELLHRGIAVFDKFLDANRSDCILVGRY